MKKKNYCLFVFLFSVIVGVFGEETLHSYTLGDDSLLVIREDGGLSRSQQFTYYIEYNNNRIGPFARFFDIGDKSNTLGEFTVKEVNNKILFLVLVAKPVSWGLEGKDGSSLIIGYNGKIYYPLYKPGSSDKLFFAISENTNALIYIKQVGDRIRRDGYYGYNAQLFNGDTPISNEYSSIKPLKIDGSDIYYIGYKYRSESDTNVVCCNETILFNIARDIDIDDIQITSNNNMFYKTGGYFSISTVYRNGVIFYEPNSNISSFVVSDDEKNIAYTVNNSGGSTSIFRNGKEHYRSPGMILNPTFSPDGKKLYFFEAAQDRGALAFVINGPNIPLSIAGPYLRPSGYDHISFSNDSKYVAFVLESYRNVRGMCIILNDKRYGPYGNVRNYHFSSDSKTYSFEYLEGGKWYQQVITLK